MEIRVACRTGDRRIAGRSSHGLCFRSRDQRLHEFAPVRASDVEFGITQKSPQPQRSWANLEEAATIGGYVENTMCSMLTVQPPEARLCGKFSGRVAHLS